MKGLWHSFACTLEKHPQRTFLLCSFLLIGVLYGRVLFGPFIYDDLDQIVNNSNLQAWNRFAPRFLEHPVDLNGILLRNNGSQYRPLFYLSLYVDRNVWGLHPFGFHATNLLLHYLNGYLLFLFLRKVHFETLAATGVSLVWLMLPINTEVVAWISARVYLLCTFCILLFLISALTYQERGTIRWGAISFLTALAALFSLELGIAALPLLLLVNVATRQWKSRRAWCMAGSVALAIACAEIARTAVGANTFTVFAPVRWAALALWQYIALTLLPIHMSVDRSTTISLQEAHPWWWVGLVGFALALLLATARHRRTPALLNGFLWFLIAVAPFCFIMPYYGIAERTAYLPSIGIIVVIATAFGLLQRRLAMHPIVKQSVLACAFLWLMWSSGRTFVRNGDWTDPIRLYGSSLIATPRSASLHFNLGFTLREEGNYRESLAEYYRTLEINPLFPNTYASIGDVYLRMDEYTNAEEALQKALAQTPHDTSVLLNLGAAYQSAGNTTEAEITYRKILEIDPKNTHAHTNLGVLYLAAGQTTDAMREFATAIDLKSTDIVPYYDLGVLFQQQGRGDFAMVFYKKALELKPDDPDTLRNMQMLQKNY